MNTAKTNPIRVLLVDDHTVMRVALRMLIDSRPDLAVVGEAATRGEALEIAAREQPDIILLDLDLGGENGLDVLRELFDVARQSRVIVLTGIRNAEEYRRAVGMGALGLVLKDQAVETLVTAIKRVHAGEAWLDRALVASVLSAAVRAYAPDSDPEAARIASLTDRERDVLALVCRGLKNKQIGERLSISETTVGHHLSSIFEKLGLSSRLELVTYAYQHGLVKPQ